MTATVTSAFPPETTPNGHVNPHNLRRLALLPRYDGRAPRYTSYPTALQFTDGVNEAVYREWLEALPADQAISLYVHIPFCSRLCWYCGCNTRAVKRGEAISDYVGYLEKELALLETALPGRMRVGQIHLGGGTPNMLSVDDLTQLFGALKHVFRLAPGADIAAELDPFGLTRDWVRAAVFHGLTRASLGVQDLSPDVQAAVNRRGPFSMVGQAVTWLREAGVDSINLDLMYGLPRQREADVLATLDRILSLRPERIALFGYAHVPWAKPHQKLIATTDLPDAAQRLEQSEEASTRLEGEGYVRIGLDHFALPTDPLAVALMEGRVRRNFQGYTDDPFETLIGLGASSIGHLPQGYVQNDARELTWRARLDQGALPIARGLALTDDDRFRGEVIGRLMCDLAVDLDEVCALHGRPSDTLAPEVERLARFAEDGIIEVNGPRVTVTEFGRPFLRAVAAVFDTQYGGSASHARIV